MQRKVLVFIRLFFILNVVGSTIFNVREFGAKGDGVTDDTPAVLQAIGKCMVDGGVLYIPSGEYVIRSSLIFKSNNHYTISGDGMNSILLWEFNDHLIVISPGLYLCHLSKLFCIEMMFFRE